jgi:hypothetical protein
MKKIGIVLILIVLGSIYFFTQKQTYITIENGIKNGNYILAIDVPQSDGKKVSFSKTTKFNNQKFAGSGFDISGSSSKGSVVALLEKIETLDSQQFLLPFFVNYGGSGTFLYIGLFDRNKNIIKHSDSILVGDRVELLNLKSVDDTNVILEYNDYKQNRSMSTIPDKYTKIVLKIKDKKILKTDTN